jgi:lipopolysaccharide export LptBFGC system permease protein LptF
VNTKLYTNIGVLPSYADLKEPPKSVEAGTWTIFIILFVFFLYNLKEFISVRIDQHKEALKAEIEEKKALLKERQDTIDYYQDLNNRLLNQLAIAKSLGEVDSAVVKRLTEEQRK